MHRHDASDCLQYTTTSANAIYQMMFAYQQNPGAFGDYFQANGLPGANGIPDIIDEIYWGMDWLSRMKASHHSWAFNTSMDFNTVTVHFDSPDFDGNTFDGNGTALLLESLPKGETLLLNGCVFRNNGTDIENRSTRGVDSSGAVFGNGG